MRELDLCFFVHGPRVSNATLEEGESSADQNNAFIVEVLTATVN